jgi:enoyl-CoA hydratase/3-hydroxyacyl-CoA dehydrogenase
MSRPLERSIDGDVVHIGLGRPHKLNPMGPAQWADMRDALHEAEATPGVRAVVIGAEGRMFCAGNDLAAMDAMTSPEQVLDYFLGIMLPALVDLASSPLPVLCRVQGDAIGGGIELSMYSDLVVAADDVRFWLPEGRVGLFATTIVAAARESYGRQALQGMAFTGSQVSGEEARRLGLVHVSVPRADLDSAVATALDGIRAASPGAVAATKEALNEPLLTDGVPRARRALEKLARELMFSPDGIEGMAAFRERRTPQWTPRTGTTRSQ